MTWIWVALGAVVFVLMLFAYSIIRAAKSDDSYMEDAEL